MARKSAGSTKTVEVLTHGADKRKNIPTAEYQSVLTPEEQQPVQLRYPRNIDLDPQLVWRGKDEQDGDDLVVQAPPLYIQEKVHPKVLIDDLLLRTKDNRSQDVGHQIDLFADFNGVPEGAETEFYQHDQNWSNRMILGDSLQVMASLAEREGLRGMVQCIYIDPPYGIKFNSNFQWSTTSREGKDAATHITREPEQVKAFRDTWRDGIHSYLTYLRDRLVASRDLLVESGSVFVQIGDENVHRVRALMDEVFEPQNFISLISFVTTSGFTDARELPRAGDYLLWYAKSKPNVKARALWDKSLDRPGYRWLALPDGTKRGITAAEHNGDGSLPEGARIYTPGDIQSQGASSSPQPFGLQGKTYNPGASSHWKANYPDGMERLALAGRIHIAKNSLRYVRFADDFGYQVRTNLWTDTGTGNFTDDKVYVVQTNTKVIERCILLTTDPGDLVLDPTCGSGSTAFVAEQWGRRWITIDTSRVALALARARIMGARYSFYLLADSREGQMKEAEVTGMAPSTQPVHGNIRHGFVYQRAPHITLKSIANNTEIDVIWEQHQAKLDPLLESLNAVLNTSWQPWEVPRDADASWPDQAKALHADLWQARIVRQSEINASIASKAEFEYLCDKPYVDNKKVRVAGPFTVESLTSIIRPTSGERPSGLQVCSPTR